MFGRTSRGRGMCDASHGCMCFHCFHVDEWVRIW